MEISCASCDRGKGLRISQAADSVIVTHKYQKCLETAQPTAYQQTVGHAIIINVITILIKIPTGEQNVAITQKLLFETC